MDEDEDYDDFMYAALLQIEENQDMDLFASERDREMEEVVEVPAPSNIPLLFCSSPLVSSLPFNTSKATMMLFR